MSVICLDGGCHSIDKICLLVHILREKNTEATVDVGGCAEQAPGLQLARVVIVVEVAFIVQQDVADGGLVSVLEERFHGQDVCPAAGFSCGGRHRGVWVVTKEVHDVVRCWLVCLPGSMPPKDFLELFHAGLRGPQDIEFLLQGGILATHLLQEGNDLDSTQPSGALFTALCCCINHRQLPEVAQEDHAWQLLGVLPHRHDALEVRRGQHGHLRDYTLKTLYLISCYNRRAEVLFSEKVSPNTTSA